MLMAAPLPFRGASSCAFLLALRAGFTRAREGVNPAPPLAGPGGAGAHPVPMSPTETLAAHLAGISAASVPDAVRDRAGLVLADTLGAIVAGQADPAVAATARRHATGGPCRLPGTAAPRRAADRRLPQRLRRHGARTRRGQLSRRRPSGHPRGRRRARRGRGAERGRRGPARRGDRRLRGGRAGRHGDAAPPGRASARHLGHARRRRRGRAAAEPRRGDDRARAGGGGEPRPRHQRHGGAPRRQRAQRLCRDGGAERVARLRPGRGRRHGRAGGIAAVFGRVVGEAFDDAAMLRRHRRTLAHLAKPSSSRRAAAARPRARWKRWNCCWPRRRSRPTRWRRSRSRPSPPPPRCPSARRPRPSPAASPSLSRSPRGSSAAMPGPMRSQNPPSPTRKRARSPRASRCGRRRASPPACRRNGYAGSRCACETARCGKAWLSARQATPAARCRKQTLRDKFRRCAETALGPRWESAWRAARHPDGLTDLSALF